MLNSRLIFKIASSPEEFAQIHNLNYRTFVEEIPQHSPNPQKKLIDKFHNENTYFICLDNNKLVGMLCARSKRPFSLDKKLADLDNWLPPATVPCEFRLLAVEPEYRKGSIFADLLYFAVSECIKLGYTLGLASGTVRQTRLYKRMGFVPFAKQVGTEGAMYQPMYLSLTSALSFFDRLKMEIPEVPVKISFQPGPVEISSTVRKAFSTPAISHRSESFLKMVAETESLLCKLTGTRYASLFLGSGTLANDVLAAQLKVLNTTGVILSNGEFGDRLIDHGYRMGLKFEVLKASWGTSYDMEMIEQFLSKNQEIDWLWSTHCETSSGILNNLDDLTKICNRHKVKLCIDATSSIGTLAVNLSQTYMAISVSGKGLASLAGIAIILYNKKVESNRRIPRYLDLGFYSEKQGVPFTQSSNLVSALHQALSEFDAQNRFKKIQNQYLMIRNKFSKCGFRVIVKEKNNSPAVISIQLPVEISSVSLGDELGKRGFLISYLSDYLQQRNIIQICLMGRVSDSQCSDLVDAIISITRSKSVSSEKAVNVVAQNFKSKNQLQ